MSDLAAFLNARLDEGEAAVGPARALREAAFKRAILAEHRTAGPSLGRLSFVSHSGP